MARLKVESEVTGNVWKVRSKKVQVLPRAMYC